jgi:hypothetical protein
MRKRKKAGYLAGAVLLLLGVLVVLVLGVVAVAGGVVVGAVVAGFVRVSTKLVRSAAAGEVGMYSAPRWPQAVTDKPRNVTDNPIASRVATLFTIWLIFFMSAL